MVMLEGFQFMERMWDSVNSTAIRQRLGYIEVYPGLAPQRVTTYVLLV
jgi:hypothetical protein